MLAAVLDSPISVFIVQMMVIIASARLIGILARGIGQPLVIAEVVAGILLGPSVLGWLAPTVFKLLFPVATLKLLQLVSQIGLLVFMFLIGLELDPKLLRGRSSSSLLISQTGMFVPFLLGILLAFYYYPRLAPAGVRFLPFALFVGIAMSITAFPVLARILSERRLLRSKIGAIAIACAAFQDVAAWCLLAFVVSIVKSAGIKAAALTTLYTAIYVAVMLFAVRPFMRRFGARGDSREALTQNMVAATFVMLLLSSLATEMIGIHALFGAFMFGAILPKDSGFIATLAEKLEDFVVVSLLPLFFAYSGLRTQIGLLNNPSAWFLCGLATFVACLGKFGSVFLSARLTGFTYRESGALGVLMNTRGLMELVVLNLGLDLGVISPLLFTILVLMALFTTFLTTPLIQLIYPPSELAKELLESAERPAAAAQPREGICLLLAVSYTSAASGMLVLAAALTQRAAAASRVYALKLVPPTERTSTLVGDGQTDPGSDSAFGPMLSLAQKRQLHLRPVSFVSSQPARDICNVAEVKGADLLLLGWHRPLLSSAALGGTVNEVLVQAHCDVAVLVDRGLAELRRVLVPYHGTPDDIAALALAHRLSQQSSVAVTVLHVIPPTRKPEDPGLDVEKQVSAIFSEPACPRTGEPGSAAARVVVRVVQDKEPAEAALREIDGAERYDLVLIGIGSDWGLMQRQFGFNEEYFIRKCPTSLLVVRKSQKTPLAG